jgi:hypothetical protein
MHSHICHESYVSSPQIGRGKDGRKQTTFCQVLQAYNISWKMNNNKTHRHHKILYSYIVQVVNTNYNINEVRANNTNEGEEKST